MTKVLVAHEALMAQTLMTLTFQKTLLGYILVRVILMFSLKIPFFVFVG
jgi:hypothetical protein